MSVYKCPKCGALYSFEEYLQLERVPLVPGKEYEYGYEFVCPRCGGRFWSDRWTVKTVVEKKVGWLKKRTVKILVSTVDLVRSHPWGDEPDGYFYETMLFNEPDSEIEIENLDVVERYKTREEAERGHEKWVNLVKKAKITTGKTGWIIRFEEG